MWNEARAEDGPDKREAVYAAAIRALPESKELLNSYALFINEVRKDCDRAEEYYRKALERDPEHANNLGNYSSLLFVTGRQSEALETLRRSEAAAGDNDVLRVELLFYRIADDPESWPARPNHLSALLSGGARSVGWSLLKNIERADKDCHPNPALLRALAKVIDEQSPLSSLDEFQEGRDAGEGAT